jgi:hypothetical protein
MCVRKEEPRRAALDDRGRDRAGLDIGQRLGGEHDGGVLLAQRLEPLAQSRAESRIIEREPAFIHDEKRRPAVETALERHKSCSACRLITFTKAT